MAFVRILSWELVETSAGQDGTVTVRQRLPKDAARPEWSALHTEFVVTISDKLTIELIATNESADKRLEIENCLHTYFHVGDIKRVSITGLQGAPFDDFAAGAPGRARWKTTPCCASRRRPTASIRRDRHGGNPR